MSPVSPWCNILLSHRNEAHFVVDPGDGFGNQSGGVVQVFQVADLDLCVHVAIRQADERGRDTAPADLDGVGIRTGGPGRRAELVGDLLLLGGVEQEVAENRIDVGSAFDDRAVAAGFLV